MLKCYCTLVRRNTSQISLIVSPEAGYSQIWILELNQTPWMNGVASLSHGNAINFGVDFWILRYIKKEIIHIDEGE